MMFIVLIIIDSYHVGAIADTIKVNETVGISARLVLNEMDLPLFGWQGNEDFLLIVNQIPYEWFPRRTLRNAASWISMPAL